MNYHDDLVRRILATKKYRDIDLSLVSNIIEFASKRYPEKRLEKEAKLILHQIWAAFYTTRPNFAKLTQKLEKEVQEELSKSTSGELSLETKRTIIEPLLRIHSSTHERIGFLDQFYSEIFKITGIPGSILDLACGFNPLAYFWIDLPKETRYSGVDIDKEEIYFLKSTFDVLGVENVNFTVADARTYKSEKVDVALVLKFLPLINHQSDTSLSEFIFSIPSKFVVISFPTRSLSGRNVGMVGFYDDLLKRSVPQEKVIGKLEFLNEVVYVIEIV